MVLTEKLLLIQCGLIFFVFYQQFRHSRKIKDVMRILGSSMDGNLESVQSLRQELAKEIQGLKDSKHALTKNSNDVLELDACVEKI